MSISDETIQDIAIVLHQLELQIRNGVEAHKAGDHLLGNLCLTAALATARNLSALCAGLPPRRRKMALVVVKPKAEEADGLPAWMEQKANDPPEGAA